MKESVETIMNMSDMVFGAYRHRGKEGFGKHLDIFLDTIADKREGDLKEINRNFAALVSGVLALFLENDAKRVLREQIGICERSHNAKDLSNKKTYMIEDFLAFCDRFEHGMGLFSDQVLEKIGSTSIDAYRDMTVESLADFYGYSVSHFSKKFKKEQGISLKKAILSAKLNCAFDYLKLPNGQYRIEDIARMLGFRDVDYFRRSFKKKFGMTPQSLEMN